MNFSGSLKRAIASSIMLSISTLLFSQQPKPGLLWRISGNGLERPSYLFGTIHLTDKRVFNFGDSLYNALETSAGYAMELNPDSLMVYYFKDEIDKKPSLLLKDVVSPAKFSAAKKKLQKEFGKPAEEITVKELKSYYNEWFYSNKGQSMQSFMDAYLYNIVRRQGKWVGGIEDVQDQVGLDDEENERETANYYINDFINNNKESKRYLEEMIRRYTSNDLSLIQEISEGGSDYQKEIVLLRRNIKMASRIDSLAKVRNTFFAIGSAHLPGDSGVISLLRTRGYTLTPVISSRSIHAEEYKFQLQELPWVKVKSTTGLYTVEMPGEPQTSFLDQDEADFKMYADVTTNLYYFTMGIVGKPITNVDSLMRGLVKNIDKKAEVSGMKKIRQDSIDGLECIAKSEKLFYQIKLFYKSPAFYLAMVGTMNIDSPLPPDADKFFHSFAMNAHPAEILKSSSQVDRPDLGFSIQFPVKPGFKKKASEEDGWITNHFTGIDFQRDIFYQCIVKDIDRGYYQNGDSAAFEMYKSKISETHKVISFKHIIFQNYPAIESELNLENEGNTYYNRIINVHRGNRLYVLIVTTGQRENNRGAIDSFFNSFQLTSVRNPSWSLQVSPDGTFRTWGCSPIEPFISKDDEKDDSPLWNVYDSLAPVTFFVRKEAYPKFFWAKDDTSLLRSSSKNLVGYDSLLSYQLVSNGRSRGAEITIGMRDNHNIKKMRILLVGDSLYTVFGVAPKEFLNKPDYVRLFEDFRTSRDTARSTLYVNKRKELMNALHSTDSTTHAEAIGTLTLVDFSKEDLPDLHRAMLDIYHDSISYNSVSRSLFGIVKKLADASSIAVVRENYGKLPKEKEELKYYMLSILAESKREEAHSLLGDLLSKGLPQKGMPYEFFNGLSDSLKLARRYYPLLLKYVDDTTAGGNILALTEDLIDSSLLDKSVLIDHKKVFFDAATDLIKKRGSVNDDEYSDWYEGRRLINLIGRMELTDGNALLKKISLQENINLKYYAAVALLNNKQTVEPAVLTQIAADKSWRIELFNELKKLKRESLFPRQYFTQLHFGEAEMYNYGLEDAQVKKITYIGERTASFDSTKSKFLIFKVDLVYDGENSSYLGVVGPYKLNSKLPQTELGATGLYWDEPYNAKDLNNLLKKFLAQLEKN